MKSKENDFTGRSSGAHDVLDPPATGRGVLGGQRFSGLNNALALYILSKNYITKIGLKNVKVGM
jgi:hypothetical protein